MSEQQIIHVRSGETLHRQVAAGDWLRVRQGTLLMQLPALWLAEQYVTPQRQLDVEEIVTFGAPGWLKITGFSCGELEIHHNLAEKPLRPTKTQRRFAAITKSLRDFLLR